MDILNNYGHRGGCYPSRPQAEADNTLRDLHNSSYDTKTEFINCFIFIQNNSQFKNIAKTCLPPSMFSSSSIVYVQVFPSPQIFSKQQMSPFEVVFLLFLPCFKLLFRLVLPLETSEMSAIFTTKTICSTCSQVFSVNDVLICNKAALLTSPVYQMQNFFRFGQQELVMVNYVCAFSQSESGKYFEWIIRRILQISQGVHIIRHGQ